MPEFRKHKTGPALSQLKIHANRSEEIFFQTDWQDIFASSTPPLNVNAYREKLSVAGKNLFRLSLLSYAEGEASVTVRPGPDTSSALARSSPGKAQPMPTYTLKVKALEELVLPEAHTDAGILARVFLHEVMTPSYEEDYNLKDAIRAMNYIRNVFENRHSRRYDLFMFQSQPSFLQIFNQAPLVTIHKKVNGKDIKKVVKMSQFGPFGESYPDHEPEVQMKDIVASLEIANNFSHPYQEKFAQHVEAAIRIATAPQATPDPSPKGLY